MDSLKLDDRRLFISQTANCKCGEENIVSKKIKIMFHRVHGVLEGPLLCSQYKQLKPPIKARCIISGVARLCMVDIYGGRGADLFLSLIPPPQIRVVSRFCFRVALPGTLTRQRGSGGLFILCPLRRWKVRARPPISEVEKVVTPKNILKAF